MAAIESAWPASIKYAKGLWVKRVSGLGLKKVRVMKGLMGLEGKGPNSAERSGFWAESLCL